MSAVRPLHPLRLAGLIGNRTAQRDLIDKYVEACPMPVLEVLPLIEDIPIGQKLTYNQAEYTFTINPFNVVEIDKFLKDKAKNIISTTIEKRLTTKK